MISVDVPQLSAFALEVAEGLCGAGQKRISSRYFYDELGTSLFEAITLLPEYGLTRADERLLQQNALSLAGATGALQFIAELGSGSGKKTRFILQAFDSVAYSPIDVSASALAACERELSDIAIVNPVCADWLHGLDEIRRRRNSGPMLLLFLGSSVGNLPRDELVSFFKTIRAALRPSDFFLLGADLVKTVDTMLAAYDDPTGVTSAFNLNLLARMNRELNADFDLRSFSHEVRWNGEERRVEMHLLSRRDQIVNIRALDAVIQFMPGETIWTESSHKFTLPELDAYAGESGFQPVKTWVDREWPFAEVLWQVPAS